MTDVFSRSDAQVNSFLDNFANVGSANAVALGTSVAEWTDMSSKHGAFNGSLQAHVEAQNTAKGARETKDLDKAAAIAAARVLIKKINANPNVPALLRQQLGLPPRDTTRSKPPVPAVAPAPVVEKVGGAQVVLKAINPETDSLAKPEGAKTIRVYEKIVGHDQAPPEGIDQMTLVDVATAARITRTFASADFCKRAYYALQYANSAGEAGPVSAIVPAAIAA